jgi:predicted nuclease with TOPRIM domain
MDEIYEANAPIDFPTPKEQPILTQTPTREEKIALPVKETVERWKKEILDKIQFLKENFDQASRDRESLSQELDRLKAELDASREQGKVLEAKLAETLETFNDLLDEVSRAL